MYGNSFESFLIAVANPSQQTLERWAAENGVNGDFDSICQNTKAKAFLLGELVKTAKERKVSSSFSSLFDLSSCLFILCICSWRVLRSLELFIWNLCLSTLKETFLLLPTRRRGLNCSNTIRWVLHHFWRFWASLNILVLNLFFLFFFLIECDWWYVQDCKGRSSFSTVDPFYILVSFILSFSWSGMTFFIYVSLNKVLLMSWDAA